MKSRTLASRLLLAVTPLGLGLAATTTGAPAAIAATSRPGTVSVIVTSNTGSDSAARRAVTRLGGTVQRTLSIVHGVSASIPESKLAALKATADISVSMNGALATQSVLPGTTYEQTTATTSMYSTTVITGAQEYWKRGITGRGVDVAIIDTGVLPQNGLNGKVINGPDLSYESQDPARRYIDGYGHGTHLAGIIAGKDDGVTSYVGNSAAFIGMAPDARIVNVKVGDSNGVADVSQVIAAIGWIVQHKNDNGMNIRVLELAYATDSTDSYITSPLTFALEVAWRKGITVVVASGNEGKQSGVAMPGIDPNILTVGAVDTKGSLALNDDSVANFSSTSKLAWLGRGPDVVAPGVSIPSLRVPGGKADTGYPGARVGTRFFKGSGTSQASAVVAGAAALIAQERPNATPNQIKGELKLHAQWLGNGETTGTMGQGEINLAWVLGVIDLGWIEPIRMPATGIGSLDASRGSHRPTLNNVPISGDVDIFGKPFIGGLFAPLLSQGNSWTGGTWNGNTWSGNSWSGNSWTGNTWSGNSWSGNTWSGNTWSGSTWSGNSWSGSTWSTGSWG